MMAGRELTLIIASYCVGCLTAGYYLVKWRTGRDIRQLGSGSVGARNAGRVLGAPGFVGTFAFDFGKGLLMVWAGRMLGIGTWGLLGVMLAVVAGHNWPVQLRGRGGKGIATSLGAILAFNPFFLMALLVGVVPVLLLIRNLTLSGLFGFALAPLVIRWFGLPDAEVVGMTLLAILVLSAHHKNIRDELARISEDREGKERSSGRRARHEV